MATGNTRKLSERSRPARSRSAIAAAKTQGMSEQPAGGDAMALEHETVDRLANVVVTTVPAALLGVAIWLAWGGALHWQDLVILAVSYLITGSLMWSLSIVGIESTTKTFLYYCHERAWGHILWGIFIKTEASAERSS